MEKIISGFFILFFMATAGYCQEAKQQLHDWKHVDNKFFEFFIPSDMKKIDVQGEDSYVGQYKSRRINLNFDYGLFSDPLDSENYKDYKTHTEQIDGLKARIVSYQDANKDFVLAIHFAKAGSGFKGGTKLTFYAECVSESDYDTILKIFRSIKFK